MLDNIQWLGKKEELAYRDLKFKGKAAGTSWKYAQSIDGLIITRAVIFLMAVLVFYPILSNYLFHGVFSFELFMERVIYSAMFLTAGYLFNKHRLASVIIAVIPLIIILLMYLFIASQFSMWKVAFLVAVIFLVLRGIHYDRQSRKLKEELDRLLLENHLIE